MDLPLADRPIPLTMAALAPEAHAAGREAQATLLELAPASVPADRVLRLQGYKDLARVRPAIRRAAAAMAAAAGALSAPCAAYRPVAIRELGGDVLRLDGGIELHCPVFSRALDGCSEVVPFVLTVGAALSGRVVELAEAGDLLEAVLLESAGWLCIEDATRQFKSHLRASCLARGQRITSRLGPGYSYKIAGAMRMWPLEEQVGLFALLGQPARLPVALMASCAMQPKMSRSGMYGSGPLATPQDAIPPQERMQ